MEINYNSYIKDLPQLNPNRSLFTAPTSTPFMPYSSTTGDPFASDEAADDQPSARKVKLLCSFGGKILPRPSDGALRYAGGHTRIIAVRRDTTLLELYRKMADVYGGPVAIRYQLPDEDLDALVSVSSTEDLDNMMDEYDKLAEGSADGSAKLRVFLFSQTEVASILNENFSAGPTLTDPCDCGHKYIEAVNGDAGSEANSFAGETRVKGSTASASSTHNPDLGFDGFNKEGTSLPLLSPAAEASTFLDPSKMAFVGTATPVPLRETQGFPSSSTFLGQTMVARHPVSQSQPMLYPSQAFVESHKVPSSPQSLNMATSLPTGNIVSAPQGTYLPPMTMPPSSMPSQVGLNPVQVKVDPFSNEDQYIGTFTQAVSNPNYNIFQQPLFQIPLQSSHLHLVAPPPNGPRLRFEDCQLCQKALPHVHSDMLINELGTVSGNSMQKTRPMLQSHHSDDMASLHGHHRVASFTRMESLVEPKVEHPVNPDKNDIWGVNKLLDSGLDSDKFFMQITEKIDLPNLVQPLGTTGLSGDTQVSFGVTGNSAQSHFEGKFHQQQKQTLLDETFQPVKFVHPTNTFGLSGNVSSNGFYLSPSNLDADYSQRLHPSSTVGVSSTGEESYVAPLPPLLPHHDEFFQQQQVFNALDPLSQTEDYAKLVDGITEALNVNTFDILRSKDQLNPTVEPESLFVGGEDHILRPQNGGNVLFSSNAFLSSTAGSEGISAGPVNPLFLNSGHSMAGEDNNIVRSNRGGNKPPLSDAFVSPGLPQKEYPMNPLLTTTMDLNLFELGNTSQASMKMPSSAYTQNIERNAMPLFSNQQVPGSSSYIAGSAFTNSITGGTSLAWSDAVFQPQYLNSDISNPQCGTTPFPLWSSKVLVHDKHFEETFSSDSLLGKENCQEIIESKNTSNENQFSKVDVPDIEILLEEGALLRADWLIKESQPASVVATKDFIKQDRPYVAKLDGESAFIPLSSVPLVNGSKELNPSFIRGAGLSEEISSSHSATVLGDPRIEDVKAKQSDKLHMGIPTAKDIGRLQIIKNCDLEELRELGSGTFGTVYHGKWRGSDVAIKRINDRCFTGKPSEQEKMRGDFWNEASKLADLHHPNVVAFYGVVLDGPGGSFSTVTEYMVNGSLRSALQKNDKTFDRRKRLIIAMDVAFGMEYLHGRNIVHFDLKSDNLLVNLRDPQRPICKVGDLGLSKVKCQTLISGGVRGTLPWMAPELLNGSSNLVSDKVDVFSFGIVMWELLTGEEPYSDLHYGTIIGGIVSNTLRPPVPENCDPEWRALMEQCWSADPSLRPSFTEIANTLRAMASSLPQKGKPPK